MKRLKSDAKISSLYLRVCKLAHDFEKLLTDHGYDHLIDNHPIIVVQHPRPLAHALHGSKPNEVLHFDYLYLGPGSDSLNYVSILKDNFSSYVWLFPTESADADNAAQCICTWIAAFGSPSWFVSDQGSHFKNNLMEQIRDELKVNHHFTTAYTPWANGTVERVCREVQRTCRALLSEWNLAPQDWPSILESVQSILNCSPLKRLGRECSNKAWRCPLQVFTGQTPQRLLLRAMPPNMHLEARSNNELQNNISSQISDLQKALEEMHKSVHTRVEEYRKKSVDAHNRRTGIQSFNAEPGDFLLVRKATNCGHKLSFHWKGPRRVIRSTGPKTFEVENIITGKKEIVHICRLIKYRTNMENQELSEELLSATIHNEAHYHTVKQFHDIKNTSGQLHLHVEWEGLPDACDFTWEPVQQLLEDVPDMVKIYAENLEKTDPHHAHLQSMTTNNLD